MVPSVANGESEANEASPSIWQFVTLADYTPPPPDVVETTRRRLSALWDRVRPDVEEPVPYVKPEDELTGLPDWHLRRAAPPIEWAEAAGALDTALEGWVTDPSPDEAVRLLVTPPCVGRRPILTAWAEQRGWRVLSPPAPEQILAGGEDWFAAQFSDEGGWVLPDLERLTLRHASGLDLVCSFLDQAHAGRCGPGLIGCDSWAWAFLNHVWRGWLPPTLTLQACDEGRLAVFFRSLARTIGGRELCFRQADDGSDVLPPPDASTTTDHQSEFLHHLATYSRGNLAVAWATWRTALSSEPVADRADEEEEAEEEAAADDPVPEQTIWVTPWSQMTPPSLPSEAGRDTAFVTHTLLLHGGLPTEMVRRLLPLTPNRVTEILDGLRVAGVIALHEDRWQVTATGYPPVREFLARGGYLTDAF